MSRFRTTYRQLNETETQHVTDVKTKAEELEALIEMMPSGREKSIAMTKLEEAVLWAVKGITAPPA